MCMEDTLYAVIAIEADSRAERKSGNKTSVPSDRTTGVEDGNNLVQTPIKLLL